MTVRVPPRTHETDPFPNADAEFWRTFCLLAWQRALDLHDENERLKAELRGTS